MYCHIQLWIVKFHASKLHEVAFSFMDYKGKGSFIDFDHAKCLNGGKVVLVSRRTVS